MYIPFDQISDDSRIWIYQADRTLTEAEFKHISNVLKAFCQQWSAHQHPLNASFQIAYHRFIILAVDEAHHAASGCSIDSSVGIIRKLEQDLSVGLFNRMDVAYIANGTLQVMGLAKLKNEISNGTIHASTEVFNNLVATKGKLDSEWLMPLGQSWLAKYLPTESMA